MNCDLEDVWIEVEQLLQLKDNWDLKPGHNKGIYPSS